MMRITILTEGGKNIGVGHLTRCIGLSQKIQEKHPDVVMRFIVQGDESARELFCSYGLNAVVTDWHAGPQEVAELVEEGDFVIIDSYLADKSIYDEVSKMTSGRVLMMDDFQRFEYPQGIILNATVYGDRFKYSGVEGTQYLLGRNYIIQRKEFWPDQIKKIGEEIKNVLVTFGGMKRPEFIRETVEFLVDNYEFDVHVVLAGQSYEGGDLSNLSSKISVYQRIPAGEMRSLMQLCDLCISGGGQTLYELARCGVPTVGIFFAENQRGNLETLAELGFMEYAQNYEDKEIWERINRSIQNLSSYEIRKRRSEIGQSLVDGQGVKRIVEAIQSYLKEDIRLREVIEDDCKDLWEWRNDPEIRKWCFDSNAIPYEDHQKWFTQKINDAATKVYICLDESGTKVGQARFDVEDHKAHINVNLNPKSLGKKLGNRMIKASTEKILNEQTDLQEVIAEIKEQNVASIKAFEKAGYERHGHTTKDGEHITIYHYKK